MLENSINPFLGNFAILKNGFSYRSNIIRTAIGWTQMEWFKCSQSFMPVFKIKNAQLRLLYLTYTLINNIKLDFIHTDVI